MIDTHARPTCNCKNNDKYDSPEVINHSFSRCSFLEDEIRSFTRGPGFFAKKNYFV